SRALTCTPPGRKPFGADQGEATASDYALRPEDDDEDQDDAVHDVAVRGELAHDLGQRGQEHRADDRTEDIGGAADHGEGQDLNRARDAILRRIDEEVDVRLESARITGNDGADDEGDHLVERNIDAVTGGRQLVFADGRPRLTQPGAGQPPDDIGEDRQ